MKVIAINSRQAWLGGLIVAWAIGASASTVSTDDAYLDGLSGAWDMTGTLGGNPVRYRADGARVLQGGFLCLHMIDASPDPQYEASLYVGFDAKAGDYVGHWLDRFGAAGARVVATGKRTGDVLVLDFPYLEGAFRDTFTRHRDTWSLLMESQAADGSWKTFASYELARVK